MRPFALMRRVGAPAGSSGSGSPGTDDFSTNTLSSYTEYADNAAGYSISGGFLIATSTPLNKQSILTRNSISFVNGEVSVVITEANNAGLALRLQDNNNYYVATIEDNSGTGPNPGNVLLYKKVGGTYTQLGSTVSTPFTRGTSHTFSLSASGSSLVVKFDGVTKISVTDSAISASGKCGPRTTGGPFKVDSFTWP